MTNEQRLDRLERIAKLFVRAGLRERGNRNELNEKINIIINSQIANEERFARNEERFAQNEERFAKVEIQIEALAKAQKLTEERLTTLIEIVTRDRNGNSG